MIPLMKNTFINEYETKKKLADFLVMTSQLSMGESCFEFEQQFSKIQMTKFSRLTNSGGSANLALLQSLLNLGHLSKGDKVGFSALTWATNVMPIIQLGLLPIPVDCELDTLNVSQRSLEAAFYKHKFKAFFITNVLGFCGDLQTIKNFCESENILFIEDNCEALGTELETGRTGNFGLASTFSFFVAHHMSTIEGGCICSCDEELAEMVAMVRANGWDRNLTASCQVKWRRKHNVNSEFFAKYTFYDLAYNFRPTEITGFLGLNQLKYLEHNIRTRERYFRSLDKIVRENDELLPLNCSHIKRLSPFALPILCKSRELREKYLAQFSGAGVEVRPMIAGNIVAQPFFAKYVRDHYELPNTEFIHNCGFYCGLYPELSTSDLEVISSCILKYVPRVSRVKLIPEYI